jgi:cytochrome c peroxidase
MRTLWLVVLLGAVACDEPVPFTDEEWEALEALAGLPDPPPDKSNAYVGNPAAEALGQKFYFDAHFSGVALLKDSLYRDIGAARAERGEEVNISCATCHNPARAGADFTSFPRNVSIGGGAYDVNSQQTLNAAHYTLLYWNGRNDSLWSQILAVTESEVSMTGDRLKVAWRIADAYRDEYNAVFGDRYPLPAEMDSIAAQQARLNADGSCIDACPNTYCRSQANNAMPATTFCLPKFPLRGKPGWEGRLGVVEEGVQTTCNRGLTTYPEEPHSDNFDCMNLFDQRAVTRIYVNWSKAIAAYEYKLVSRNSAFDTFIAEGPDSTAISAAAKRGAKLFVGKAACNDCHSTPLFSDNRFHNVGVPQVGDYVPTVAECIAGAACDCVTDDFDDPQNCLPWGYREGLRRLQANGFRRDTIWSDDTECQAHATDHIDPIYNMLHPDECDGRAPFYAKLINNAGKAEYQGQWRTPSLRDIALTAPYMHNGLYDTLEDVLWHYNRGGAEAGVVGTKSVRLRPLGLTEAEISDIVAFLQTLNGAALPAELVTPPTLPP